MATPQTIDLARTLPPRLLRFFQRYPPPQLFPAITSHIAATPADTPTTPPATTLPEAAAPVLLDTAAPVSQDTAPPNLLDTHDVAFPNPFLPTKNFTTGRWHGPVYGLRKQADLVKLAGAHGVVDLLPWTIKKPGEKEARRIERGLTVKGTGEGQRVKGKLWERTLKGRLEMRRQAMLDMPRLIQEWKQVSCLWVGAETARANPHAERPRSRVEEVAQRQGEEVGEEGEGEEEVEKEVEEEGGEEVGEDYTTSSLLLTHVHVRVWISVWIKAHIATAFTQVNPALYHISECMHKHIHIICTNISRFICNNTSTFTHIHHSSHSSSFILSEWGIRVNQLQHSSNALI